MATDVDQQIARSNALLQRTSDRTRSLSSRARQRKREDLGNRIKRIVIAVGLIIAGAAGFGFVQPLGQTGLLIVMALLFATLALAFISTAPRVEPEKLAEADIRALPLQTEIWLDNQRKALPAPALNLIDSIGVRLETLAPQLARLDQKEPAAIEIRKLLADHLPELVTGYQSIPEPLRRQERNGRVPEKQLVEGLAVIDQQIGEITENLAAGDLDKLATHNRFLELKYQEAKELGS